MIPSSDVSRPGPETIDPMLREKNREVAELVDGYLKQPRREVANQIAALGIGMRMSILPRGSAEIAAENRLPKMESLKEIIDLLPTLKDKDDLSGVLRIFSEWADGSAVPTIVSLMRETQDEELILSCIHALGHIGGVEAAFALKEAGTQGNSVRIRRSAEWLLSELESGGTMDYQEGAKVRDLPPDRQQERLDGMKRIPLAD